MTLSAESQRIINAFGDYADNERLERGVNDDKIKQVMEREENRAKNTLFDNAKTIRAERNFEETFGYSEYERQLGRTGRTPAADRERTAYESYRNREITPVRQWIDDFVQKRKTETNIRIQEEQEQKEFFEIQQELTEQQRMTLDEWVESVYADMDSGVITVVRRGDLAERVTDLQEKVAAKRAEIEAQYQEDRTGANKRQMDHWAYLRMASYNRQRSKRNWISTPKESMYRSVWENNYGKVLLRQLGNLERALAVAVANVTRFDNSIEPVITLTNQLDALSRQQNITPKEVLEIDDLLKRANQAIDQVLNHSGQHFKAQIQDAIQAMDAAMTAKERVIRVNANIGGTKTGSVFESEDTIVIPEIPGAVGSAVGADLSAVLSAFTAAFNPSQEELEQMYLANLEAQMKAAQKFQARQSSLQSGQERQGNMQVNV